MNYQRAGMTFIDISTVTQNVEMLSSELEKYTKQAVPGVPQNEAGEKDKTHSEPP